MTTQTSMRRALITLIGVMAWSAAGCSRWSTEYGPTSGLAGHDSINGMAAFRTAFEIKRNQTHSVTRLSQRTGRNDALVWIPQTLGPISRDTTEWFEDWLQEGDHVLIYVLPDSGSEVDYLTQSLPLADADQRLQYRREMARAINERFQWRVMRADPPSNGWFQVRASTGRQPGDTLLGPWADRFQRTNATDQEATAEALAIEYVVGGFDPTHNDEVNQTNAANVQNNPMTTPAPTGPSSQPTLPGLDDIDVTQTFVAFQPLLGRDDSAAIVGEITSDQWPGSSILVVAGGSLLTNFALTRSINRDLAGLIVDHTMTVCGTAADPALSPAPGSPGGLNVGFLVSPGPSVAVSHPNDGPPLASGMELLSVWPLSLVTIHAIALGMVACFVMFPIFGRPKRLPQKQNTDFGHHLDAVAGLMQTADGDRYARSRIGEYARTVRGDVSSPWIDPDAIRNK